MNKTKRKILIASVALVAAAIVVTALIFAAANKGPFSGTVTDSSTGKPIADVCVTDGRNVVKPMKTETLD